MVTLRKYSDIDGFNVPVSNTGEATTPNCLPS